MTAVPKILALMEIEPPSALADALSLEFLRPLRIENPPPIRIAKPPADATWGGYCEAWEYAEHGEVVLDDYRQHQEAWLIEEWFRGAYLHEITHRFLSKQKDEKIGGDHGPVFFALQLLLFLRAGERKGGRPWFLRAGIYDLQDAWLAADYTPGQALDWACRQGEELSYTEISAEAAGEEIARKFTVWRSAMAAAPGKRRAAQAKEKEKEEELARLRNKLFGTRIYLIASLCFSFFLCAILFLDR